MKVVACLFLLVAACVAMPPTIDNRRDNIDERGEFLEGDMRLPPGMKAGIIGDNYRWPNKIVPYVLDSSFTAAELEVIRQGMEDITSNTCIQLVPRSNEADYVRIIRGGPNSGCWSYVGHLGGAQDLNLQAGSPGCIFKGIVSHELIHAIGFFHEQSRTDRDDYVSINWGNIQAGTEGNFNKYSAGEVNPFNVPYDYGSIMHYSAYSFAIDPNVRTIIPNDPNAVIGQRERLSSSDIQKLRNMYQC